MLDGAEEVLREQGYGALTSRSVAEFIGVKQRLIYYYFENMDDLIVETFRRLAGRDLERLTKALEGKHSLRDIWENCVDIADTRLTSEFVALANRIEALQIEVIAYTEKTRQMLSDALMKSSQRTNSGSSLSPAAAVFFATSAAIALHREAALGIQTGHAETMAVIEAFIAEHDRAD
jgi:AcrR family transcriptional regulator